MKLVAACLAASCVAVPPAEPLSLEEVAVANDLALRVSKVLEAHQRPGPTPWRSIMRGPTGHVWSLRDLGNADGVWFPNAPTNPDGSTPLLERFMRLFESTDITEPRNAIAHVTAKDFLYLGILAVIIDGASTLPNAQIYDLLRAEGVPDHVPGAWCRRLIARHQDPQPIGLDREAVGAETFWLNLRLHSDAVLAARPDAVQITDTEPGLILLSWIAAHQLELSGAFGREVARRAR